MPNLNILKKPMTFPTGKSDDLNIERNVRVLIEKAVRKYDSLAEAARALKIHSDTLKRKLSEYDRFRQKHDRFK